MFEQRHENAVLAQDLTHRLTQCCGSGAAARAKRDELNAHALVLNFVARVLGVKTEERAWRVGAKGEEKVARELDKLGDAWPIVHAVRSAIGAATSITS